MMNANEVQYSVSVKNLLIFISMISLLLSCSSEEVQKSKMIEAWKKEAQANLNLAEQKFENEQYDEAAKLFRQLLTYDEYSTLAKFRLGIIYNLQNEYKLAAEFLNENLKNNPFHRRSYHLLATIYRKMGEQKKSINVYKKGAEYGDPISQKMLKKRGIEFTGITDINILKKNLGRLKYPPIAQRAGVEGNVLIDAFIGKSGEIDSLHLKKRLGAGCDTQALKFVKSLNFDTLRSYKSNSDLKLTIPIRFSLENYINRDAQSKEILDAYDSSIELKRELIGNTEDYLGPIPMQGFREIVEQIYYPKVTRDNNVDGTVIAKGYINDTGGLEKVKIIKKLNSNLDYEVAKALRGERFTKKNGKPLDSNCWVNFYISFEQQGKIILDKSKLDWDEFEGEIKTEKNSNDSELDNVSDHKQKEKINDKDKVYFVAVEKMPVPVNGTEELNERANSYDVDYNGVIYARAYINEKGTVTKVELITKSDTSADKIAKKTVKSTEFFPGLQHGKPVPVKLSIPIDFD